VQAAAGQRGGLERRQVAVQRGRQRVAACAQLRAQTAAMAAPAGADTTSSAASWSGPETKKSSTMRAARRRAPAAPRAPMPATRRPGAADLVSDRT
jgi:hypothetical protein